MANPVTLPPDAPRRREIDEASRAARLARRVANPDACTSLGIESLLQDGHYGNPLADSGGRTLTGVLMFKPGFRVTPATLADLARRCGECGYVLAEGRAVSAEIVRERRMIHRHYRVHQEIAEQGGLTPEERLRLLRVYDRPEFVGRYHLRPHELVVMPVAQFMERSGVPVEVINRWSESSANTFGLNAGGIDGANEIGDDKYVNVFADSRFNDGRPVFLLNPHMPSVVGWFEHARHPLVVCLLEAYAPDALPWARMRHEFCGSTDPATAQPGSLRRDSYEGFFSLSCELEVGVSKANNGVHLSNGPVEALREIAIWFEKDPREISIGRALAESGTPIDDILGRSYIQIDGATKVMTEATKGATVAETVALLRKGRLMASHPRLATQATLDHVDVAHGIAKDLAVDPDVLAVIATGSVARNRASADSDLDLVIVANPGARAPQDTRRLVAGMVVECEWMTPAEALATVSAAGGDLKTLRESSRLGFGCAIHDPRGLCREYEAVSRRATPDRALIRDHLIAISDAFDALDRSDGVPNEARWNYVRAILDALSVVLLAFHPFRYQKPKWVVQDLEAIGLRPLRQALLRAYGVDGGRNEASRALSLVREFLAHTAERFALPDYETVLREGLLDRVPEYSFVCRCLADAESLIHDTNFEAAEYTAKFTARLALSLGDETERMQLEQDGRYRALFGGHATDPLQEPIYEECLIWSEAALDAYRTTFVAGAESEPGESA